MTFVFRECHGGGWICPSLQSGYAGVGVGDLMRGREEGTHVFEVCKAQGSCCSSDDVA
jgi:hypothetical protein